MLVIITNTVTVDLLGMKRLKLIKQVFVEVFCVQGLLNTVLNVHKASHIYYGRKISYLLFGCPTVNFWPFSRGQVLTRSNYCIRQGPEGHQKPRKEANFGLL